jgi:hypothetical protein
MFTSTIHMWRLFPRSGTSVFAMLWWWGTQWTWHQSKNHFYTKKTDKLNFLHIFFLFLDTVWIGQFVNYASRYVMNFTVLWIFNCYVLRKSNFRIGKYECVNRG